MAKPKVNLIMHPTRMRIIVALIDRQLTPLQLSEILVDVPQTTLYRHLNKLAQHNLLQIVAERPVRGTLEKVYALNPAELNLPPSALEEANKEDLMRYFTAFAMGLIADFERYLEGQAKVNLVADLVSFRQAPLYLSDEEAVQFLQEIAHIVMHAFENKPAKGRRRRIFSAVFMPGADTTDKIDQLGQD